MLFFFAGYEIDFERIRGSRCGWRPRLGAVARPRLLARRPARPAGPRAVAPLHGLGDGDDRDRHADPDPDDAGELRTRFGTYLLAAGAVGEFGPILLITLVFSTESAARRTRLILIAFVVVAVLAAVCRGPRVGRGWALLERTLETSGQLPSASPWSWCSRSARWPPRSAWTCCSAASSPGDRAPRVEGTRGGGARVEAHRGRLRLPDPLLLRRQRRQIRPDALLTDNPIRLLELPLFLALFLIVRGTPALLLYRGVLDFRDRAALAVFSATGLPLIVAITTIAVTEGHMRSSTAAALVGAGILSTAILPIVGLRLRSEAPRVEDLSAPAGAA